MVQAVIHILQRGGTLIVEFTVTGSNMVQERNGTEQIQLTGNCYVPTANFN